LGCEDGRNDFGQLPTSIHKQERGREGCYISVVIWNIGITVLTKHFCMKVKALTLWLLCYNFQFGQLLGSLFLRLDLGRPSNITDEGMPGAFVVQCLMAVLWGRGVVAGTVEAGQTHIDAVFQILRSHQLPNITSEGRKEGNGGVGVLLENQSTACIPLCGQSGRPAGDARQRHGDTPLPLASLSWMSGAQDQETAPVWQEHTPASQKQGREGPEKTTRARRGRRRDGDWGAHSRAVMVVRGASGQRCAEGRNVASPIGCTQIAFSAPFFSSPRPIPIADGGTISLGMQRRRRSYCLVRLHLLWVTKPIAQPLRRRRHAPLLDLRRSHELSSKKSRR